MNSTPACRIRRRARDSVCAHHRSSSDWGGDGSRPPTITKIHQELRSCLKSSNISCFSVDGVFEDPARLGFMQYRDDAYLRDRWGLLSACDVMLMGRNTYESLAKI